MVNTTNGVNPLFGIAQFNQNQTQGLANLANMQYQQPGNLGYMQGGQQAFQQAIASRPDVAGMFNQGNQFYNQANTAINKGMQGLTNQQFQAGVNQYMNPYQQQVVDSTVNRLNQQGDQVRARLMASKAGQASFGNTSNAMQLSELARNQMQQIGDTVGNLNYQGFNQAASNALNQFNTERNREMQGGEVFGRFGQSQIDSGFQGQKNLQDLVQTGALGNQSNWFNTNQMNALKDKQVENQLAAGYAQQAQSQRIQDLLLNQFNQQNAYPLSQLQAAAGLVQPFQSNNQSSTTKGADTGLLSKIAGVAGMFAGGGPGNFLAGAVQQGTLNPWFDPDKQTYTARY